MSIKEKIKLISLGEQLFAVGTQFRFAQTELEKAVEKYGMSSDQAVKASQQCSDLTLRFSDLEEKFLALKADILQT